MTQDQRLRNTSTFGIEDAEKNVTTECQDITQVLYVQGETPLGLKMGIRLTIN